MEKQNLRMFILLAMLAVGLFLYNSWQQDHAANKQRVDAEAAAMAATHDLPKLSPHQPTHDSTKHNAEIIDPTAHKEPRADEVVLVSTDVLTLKISKAGGDIIYLALPKFPVAGSQNNDGFVLLDRTNERNYIVQSGLLSSQGPDSPQKGRAVYRSQQTQYTLLNDELVVDLQHVTAKNVTITKRFTFTKGSYVLGVEYLINNAGSGAYKGTVYGRLRRSEPEKSESGGMAMRTYTGAAVTTAEQKYVKVPFADMEKKAFKKAVSKGWAAMTEHYFTTAWIPQEDAPYQYHSETFADKTFSIGFVGSPIVVAPGEHKQVSATLYAGPGITQALQELAPGLELTVDYGMLWWICQPIFKLMSWLYSVVGNWGVAIILVTVLIKLAFYKLSATSYRSMGNMRKLQPKMEELKSRFGDDRQKYGQAVMELYKKEKINPLGGCLPILVQIPVFIALYYVLLESVELRQAPFMFWLHDLSAKDPFYVLPVIMGVSMFFQQRMNPAPPDPIQAKVMMAMPLVFTVLFLQFPSGLVLYWVVNNLLSIAQQWMITRNMEVAGAKKKT